MRSLVLLRGAPGCGKSTWIKDNSLEPYTISSDTIRLMVQSPCTGIDGKQYISQKNDGRVWDLLFDILEDRMERGEFAIVDATHAKVSMISRYKKLCERYRYRMYVVDFFSQVSLDECKERNKKREQYKFVPEDVLDNAYARYKTQPTPNYCVVIRPYGSDWSNTFCGTNWIGPIGSVKLLDFNKYKQIHIFGDIHGCFEQLKKYFDYYPYNDSDYYIFTGDYFDRGIQNAEVFNFLYPMISLPNVYLLEGNHERHIHSWAFDDEEPRGQFAKTVKQFADGGVTKADARQFYRKLGQLGWFVYCGNKILVTHGGIPSYPNNFQATCEFVSGVGKYEDYLAIEQAWNDNTDGKSFQIHGHRNTNDSPVMNGRCFNLCEKVEFGGNFRVIRISQDGFSASEYKNDIYDKTLVDKFTPVVESKIPSVEDLRKDRNIRESKQFGNVSSFNFTRDAFNDRNWTANTTRSRGLFLNVKTGDIVARSYNKFFAVGEHSSTQLGELHKNLVFPLSVYVKENGFLGITGYDEESDTFFLATKSTVGGPYQEWFREILTSQCNGMNEIERRTQEDKVSFLFEVIDPTNDPHIIEYRDRNVVLLDVINRDFEGARLPYDELLELALSLGIRQKTRHPHFDTWEQFREWYDDVDSNMNIDVCNRVEGYVVEDSNGFMFRLKNKWYKFWKQMRGVQHTLSKGRVVNTSQLYSPLHNEVYAFMQKIGREQLSQISIIDVRNKFEAEQ